MPVWSFIGNFHNINGSKYPVIYFYPSIEKLCSLCRNYRSSQVILTHGVSGGCWDLAHWRRGWLHPGWRHTIGIWRHMRAAHVWHWWRIVVRATMTLVHAMEIPVIIMAWIHPRRTILKGVLWEIEILSFSFSNASKTFKDALIY